MLMLIIEDNSVYEIDEECMRKMTQEQIDKEKKEKEKPS